MYITRTSITFVILLSMCMGGAVLWYGWHRVQTYNTSLYMSSDDNTKKFSIRIIDEGTFPNYTHKETTITDRGRVVSIRALYRQSGELLTEPLISRESFTMAESETKAIGQALVDARRITFANTYGSGNVPDVPSTIWEIAVEGKKQTIRVHADAIVPKELNNLFTLIYDALQAIHERSPEEDLCNKTRGFFDLKDCPICPPMARCETCDTGCQCPQGTVWNTKIGCFIAQ